MPSTREQILEMLATGRINAAEADRLLKDLEAPRRPSAWKWFNPLASFSTRTSLLVAGATTLAQLALSLARVRFDGALDSHFARTPIAFGTALLDVVVAWPLAAAVFWGASLAVARRGRFVDFLGAVGLARVPMVLTGAVMAVVNVRFPVNDPRNMSGIGLALLAIVSTPLIVWFFVLLFQGYRTASGLRGVRVALSFIGALIVAEILSKAVLSAF